MKLGIEDIEKFLEDPESMGLCPLCDNVIETYEEAVLVTAFGCKTLGHKVCVDDAIEEEKEDDDF